ncbi:FHA domain-containing protein [Actinomyces timonensis]|uniref:FHA domain-containing protein n=1 Tax=Actinomyces timonensis TaxID=1288391 RepID=A0AAU8N5W7_9ACTO
MTLSSTSGTRLLPPHLASAPPARLSARFIALLLDSILLGLLGLVVGVAVGAGGMAADATGAAIGGAVGGIVVLWALIRCWLIALMRTGATPGMRIAGVTWVRWSYPDYPGRQGLLKRIVQLLIGALTANVGTIIVYLFTRDEYNRFWFDRVTDIYVADAKSSSLPWGQEPIAVAPAYDEAGSPLAMMGGSPMGGAAGAEPSTGDPRLRPDGAPRAEGPGLGAQAHQAPWQQDDQAMGQADWRVAPAPAPDAVPLPSATEPGPALAPAPDAAEMLAPLQAQTAYIDQRSARAAFEGSQGHLDDSSGGPRGAHAASAPQAHAAPHAASAPQAPSAPVASSGAGTPSQWPSPESQGAAPAGPAPSGWLSALQSAQPQAPQTGPEGVPASGPWQPGGWAQAPAAPETAQPLQQGYAPADQLAQAYQTGQRFPQAPQQPYQAPGQAHQAPGAVEPAQPFQQPAPYQSSFPQAQHGVPAQGGEPAGTAPFQAPSPGVPAPQAPSPGAYEAQVAGAAATVVFDRSSAQQAGIGAPALRLALDTGQVVPLAGPSLIGRAPVAAGPWAHAQPVPVDDPAFSISKTHAVITHDGGRLVIQDLQSTNGTVVVEPNGAATQVLPGMMVPLPVGAMIRLGERAARVEA